MQIKTDMASGAVPATVSTFAELHHYVDANEYLIYGVEAMGYELDAASETQAAWMNTSMDMVNVWLAAK